MNRTLLIAPLALAISTPAWAQPGGHGMRGMSPERIEERVEHALDHVEATDTQRITVRGILEETLPQLHAYHVEAGELRQEIRTLFQADTIDRDALELARTDLVDLIDRVSATAFGTLADFAEVFTVDQRASLRQLREERRSHWAKRLGFGR